MPNLLKHRLFGLYTQRDAIKFLGLADVYTLRAFEPPTHTMPGGRRLFYAAEQIERMRRKIENMIVPMDRLASKKGAFTFYAAQRKLKTTAGILQRAAAIHPASVTRGKRKMFTESDLAKIKKILPRLVSERKNHWTPPPGYFTNKEAATLCEVKWITWQLWKRQNILPAPTHTVEGSHLPLYSAADLTLLKLIVVERKKNRRWGPRKKPQV